MGVQMLLLIGLALIVFLLLTKTRLFRAGRVRETLFFERAAVALMH
jgi:hypothetical protein